MKSLLPIIFILVSIAAFIFAVNPWFNDVKTLKADILVYNTALNNSTDLQRTEDSFITTYNSIKQSDKDRLATFLPNSVNNIQFILEIERIANLHNMPIKDLKFEFKKKEAPSTAIAVENVSETKSYGIFPVEFSTEGNFDSFVLFLKDLESNLRLVDVKSVVFSVPDTKVGDTGNSNVYTYMLKVETYWLK